MAGGRGRQRSHSYYSPEDCKNYGVQTQTVKINLRPRSRYVFTIYLKTLNFFNGNDELMNDELSDKGCLFILWQNWITDK